MRLQDLPPAYQAQARAQLEAAAPRCPHPVPERDPRPTLEPEGQDPLLLVDPARTLLVRIVRIGGRRMDDDNLTGGCKELRDAIAAALGRRGDSEADGFAWEYAQEPGGEPSVVIEVLPTKRNDGSEYA